MQIHTLQRKTKQTYSAQVGRGGKRGKTSGRGTKGQKARAGHKIRPQIRDIIKKLPKLRGRGKNSNKSFTPKYFVIKLSSIIANFKSGETVSPIALFERKMIPRKMGKFPSVKILRDIQDKIDFIFDKVKISRAENVSKPKPQKKPKTVKTKSK